MGKSHGQLTQPERCKISNNYLPDSKETIMSYDAKIFCGTYSRDGRRFVTASQGEYDMYPIRLKCPSIDCQYVTLD